MADFKLSRIRFTWKGIWASGSDYLVDDMVEHGGGTYVALRSHTSATFYNDLGGTDVTPASPKWVKQSEGVEWTGDWAVSTEYANGSLVRYGSSIYQCTEPHTSAATFSSGTDGLVADITKWTLVSVTSADWKNIWTVNTLYRTNDLVRYNGKVYKAKNQHVSATTSIQGLEANQSDWEILSDNEAWAGSWSIGTRYRVNDLIKYGGIVYKCIQGHTSADNLTLGLEEDQSKWTVQVEGIEYKSSWAELTRYKVNDIVKRGGNLMKAIAGHTSSATESGFSTDYAASKWVVFLPGSEYEGVWSPTTQYQPNDLALYGGYVYKATTYNVNSAPGINPTDWSLTFEGYNMKEDWNMIGADSGFVDYKTGDVVRHGGGLYVAIKDNSNLQPDQNSASWELIMDGRKFRNTWEDDTEYFRNDIVTWQGTSYLALQYHRSTESASRPDIDVEQPDQNYWKIMILGTRTNKLARLGDLKTFEDQDSTAVDTARLAIGSTGQTLRAYGTGLPGWDTLDTQDNVYYVAQSGVDSEGSGKSWNSPFKTVKFAMTYLLRDEKNRIGRGSDSNTPQGDQQFVGNPTFAVGSRDFTTTTFRITIPTSSEPHVYRDGGRITKPDNSIVNVSNATFDNKLGHIIVTTDAAHGLSVGDTITVEGLRFSVQDGITIIPATNDGIEQRSLLIGPGSKSTTIIKTATNHGLSVGDKVAINEAYFDCSAGTKKYPFTTSQGAFTVSGVSLTTNTFEVYLGPSNTDQYYKSGGIVKLGDGTRKNVTGFVYNKTSGIATITCANHTLTGGDTCNIYSILTTCKYGTKVYPAAPDSGIYRLNITSQPDALQVFLYPNSLQHTFRSDLGTPTVAGVTETAGTTININAATYDNVTGLLTVTTASVHGRTDGDLVRLNPMIMNCPQGQKSYPDTSKNSGVYKVYDVPSTTTYTVFVGKSNYVHTYVSGGGHIPVVYTQGTTKSISAFSYTTTTTKGSAIVRVAAGDYPEILPISIPANVALVGAELRSTTLRPAIQGLDTVAGEVTATDPTPEALTIPTDNNRKDMFYVRNGGGLRDMTLKGLTGTLGVANTYGTKRPTGGAYVSLDPGTGPTDSSVWITDQSSYIQGVTAIGDNCVGMKVDGALHAAGNKSIVANDFTQVLSDGIGYWATNLGRSELVSVFTYYGHIGYLSENGGILRSANGNNSYGDFGSVAEGFDSTETPQTATVNNRTSQAVVEDVVSNGTQIFALSYLNAGETYTSATTSVTGSGTGLDMRYEEFRDGGIAKVDLNKADGSTNIGGLGFKFGTNRAQGGNLSQITLSGAEARTAAQMNGLRIMITSGTGTGQYGYIWNYNPGTKVANIYRESDNSPGWDNIIHGKVNAIALDATTGYEYEARVSVADPTWAVTTTATHTGIVDVGFSSGLGLYYYAQQGTDNFMTSTDGAVFSQIDTGFSKQWQCMANTGPIIMGLANNDAEMIYSNDGTTWDTTSLPGSGDFKKITVGGSTGTVVMVAMDDSNTIYKGTIETDSGSTVAPQSWTSITGTGIVAGKDVAGLAYGLGRWIILYTDGYGAYSDNNGTTWTQLNLSTNLDGAGEAYSGLVYGNNAWVASMNQADRLFYSSGKDNAWYDSNLVGDSGREDYQVAYSQGAYVVVSSTGTTLTSSNAITWTIRGTNQNCNAIVGGVQNNIPTWVATGNTNQASKITGGATAFMRAEIKAGKIDKFKIYHPGSGYIVAPTVTIYDSEGYSEPYFTVRTANGVLPQPEFYNRGTGYLSAITTITGNGYAEVRQVGNIMKISGLNLIPGPGANVRFASQPDSIYRLVKVTASSGVAPNINITFQISPVIGISVAPAHAEGVTIRERYSQVRLTGHDFLDIGTGNFASTNYPGLYVFGQGAANETEQSNEVVESNGGRVFYTSTDQDGNYRVGELFRVSQAQGGVTLNADFFNLEGLDEIRLGGIRVGGTQAVIKEFSTDNTFVANSNEIIPTQRALKSYIENRFTGGGSNLFTNKLTAGQSILEDTTYSNTAGSNNPSAFITIDKVVDIQGSLGGGLAALNLFLSSRTERDDFNG